MFYHIYLVPSCSGQYILFFGSFVNSSPLTSLFYHDIHGKPPLPQLCLPHWFLMEEGWGFARGVYSLGRIFRCGCSKVTTLAAFCNGCDGWKQLSGKLQVHPMPFLAEATIHQFYELSATITF